MSRGALPCRPDDCLMGSWLEPGRETWTGLPSKSYGYTPSEPGFILASSAASQISPPCGICSHNTRSPSLHHIFSTSDNRILVVETECAQVKVRSVRATSCS